MSVEQQEQADYEQSLQDKIDDLENDIKDKDREIDDLERDVKSLEKQVSEFEDEVSELEEEIESWQSSCYEKSALTVSDAGIGTIYWRTDNLKLQQVLEDFLTNQLPSLL